MADQMPPNDPLANRLRATFAAEHADIERRHLAGATAPGPSRSFKWIPFAVAAVLITIAGFAFIGNRGDNQAVELDVAAQPLDGGSDTPQHDDSVAFLSGTNLCGDSYNPSATVLSTPDGSPFLAVASPDPSDRFPVPTRMFNHLDRVELAGGCAMFPETEVPVWFEIVGAPNQPNDWIPSFFLVTEAEVAQQSVRPTDTEQQDEPRAAATLAVPAPNECGEGVGGSLHFVWDVSIDDPDGGLIAHTAAGVDEPETRIIDFDEIVVPTGGCALTPNGARWYELFDDPGETDWVNAQFLRASEPACLRGEQFGFILRNEQLVHRVQSGDTPESLAEQYDIPLEELVGANPTIETGIAAGDLIWIPGVASDPVSVFGPVDGQAIVDGDRIAFNRESENNYRWYSTDGFDVGTTCTALTGDDTFEARPCTQSGPPLPNPADDQLYLSSSAGDPSSTADHVHDLRIASNDVCTRVVITFGENANEDVADAPAAILPPVIIASGTEFVRISPNDWAMESAFTDPDRIEYAGGIGLLTLSPGFQLAVELMHRDMEPRVRLFDNPARVVIDLFPVDSPDPRNTGPFGERFVLRGPIQQDLTGQGIPVDNDIVVNGFGRPFEAAGLYRIWSVPDDVDPDAFLADPPEPLIEEFFPTFGSADAWGRFDVDLPFLDPGTYIAVFGELPPTDEIGFYGTGQLFRVADAPTEEPGTWPEAVLLPNVQLPPE